MSETKLEIIVLQESTVQSLIRDLFSFSVIAGTIGIGVLLDSSAMQLAGAILAFIIIFGRASGKAKRMTKEQALAYINGLD